MAAPRIYLCATEWIGVLTGEEGSERTRDLIDRAKRGQFEIIGSELLRAEVLSPGALDLLDQSVRIWASVDRRVALRVAEQRIALRSAGWAAGDRRTPDLIHVATAVVAGVEAFISTDPGARSAADHQGLAAYNRPDYPSGEFDLS